MAGTKRTLTPEQQRAVAVTGWHKRRGGHKVRAKPYLERAECDLRNALDLVRHAVGQLRVAAAARHFLTPDGNERSYTTEQLAQAEREHLYRRELMDAAPVVVEALHAEVTRSLPGCYGTIPERNADGDRKTRVADDNVIQRVATLIGAGIGVERIAALLDTSTTQAGRWMTEARARYDMSGPQLRRRSSP